MNNCNCKKQIYDIKKQHFKNCRITPACATRDIPFVLTDEGPVPVPPARGNGALGAGIVILPPDEVDGRADRARVEQLPEGTSRVELTISPLTSSLKVAGLLAQPDISPDENTAEGPVPVPPARGNGALGAGIVILPPDEVAPPEEGPVPNGALGAGIVILSPDEVIELTDISPEELMEQEEEETRIKNELALIQLSKLTKKKIRK